MTTSSLDLSSEAGPTFPAIVPGKVILNGENPFIRLSDAPVDPFTTDASLWTITDPTWTGAIPWKSTREGPTATSICSQETEP